jgi:hypothetical protein
METKKINTAEHIRALINKGYNNKDIIDKLKCKPQSVYTVRYQLNKQRGLGSIGGGVAAPVDGIGTPPKRKYVRVHVRAEETGIVVSYPKVNPYYPKGRLVELPVTMIKQPTLWQRVKEWFRG